MARKPSGLVQRGNVYWIRIRVKEELRPFFRKTEFTRSLHTRNFDEALERFWPLKAEFERMCAEGTRQMAQSKPVHLSESMAEHFALAWFRETIDRVQEETLSSLGNRDLDQQLAELNEEEAHLIAGREEELLPSLQSLADKILIENGFPAETEERYGDNRRRQSVRANVDRQSSGYWKLIEIIKRGLVESTRRERQILCGQPIETIDPIFAPLVTFKLSDPADNGHISLSNLIEAFLSTEKRSERTQLDMRAAIRPMLEVIGADTPIKTLTPANFTPCES